MVAGAHIELHEELGRGGQGVVLRGTLVYPSGPRREVAVKRLMPSQDVVYASDAVGRLRDEATALAALNHPAIPDFVALSAVGDDLALITRYVDGHDLSWVLDRGDVLSPRAAGEVLQAVADALDAALAAPGPDGQVLALVHRDVKPANIRVDVRGHVWLLDFGLARSDRLERDARTTKLGVVGSPSFIAPERARGQRATGAADVFSLGLLALELLGAPRALPSGWTPAGEASLLTEQAWASRCRRRLNELPDAPEGLVTLIREMLAWQPERRPSAAAVRDRLRGLLNAFAGESLADWAAGLPRVPRSTDPPGARLPVQELSLGGAGTGAWVIGWRGVAVGAAMGVVVASCGAFAPTYFGFNTRVQMPRLGRSADPAAPAAVVPSGGAAASSPREVAPWKAAEPTPYRDAAASSVRGAPPELAPATPGAGDTTPDPRHVVRSPEPTSRREPVRAHDAEPPAARSPGLALAGGEALGEPVVAEPPPPTRWRSISSQPVRLRRGETTAAPGDAEPGPWTVEADFGEGFVEAGEIHLPVGADLVVRCLPYLRLCEVRP